MTEEKRIPGYQRNMQTQKSLNKLEMACPTTNKYNQTNNSTHNIK